MVPYSEKSSVRASFRAETLIRSSRLRTLHGISEVFSLNVREHYVNAIAQLVDYIGSKLRRSSHVELGCRASVAAAGVAILIDVTSTT